MAKKPKAIGNLPDAETIRRLYAEIERNEVDIKSEMMAAAARCKRMHEAIRDCCDALKDAGLTRPVIKATRAEKKALKAAAKARGELEGDDVALGEYVREKLGGFADLPLGAAAVAEAEKDDAERDIRPDFLKRRADQRAAENVAALTGKDGIKPLEAGA